MSVAVAAQATVSNRVFQHSPHGYPTDAMAMSGGILHIPARALVLSRLGDVVLVHPDLLGEVPAIRAHYAQIGLDCAQTVLGDMSFESVPGLHHHTLDPFLFGDAAHAVQPNARRLHATKRFNNKNWFVRFCAANGYNTPAYACFAAGQKPVTTTTLPVFVKAAVSGGGMHVVECHTWQQVEAAAAQMPGPYQVQQKVPDVVESLNVMYHAEPGNAVRHVLTSAQILEGGVEHAGNRFPAIHNPRELTDSLANACASAGVEGYFAFDVLVDSQGQLWAIECNPRPNGSTYYAVAAARLGSPPQWQGVNLPTGHRRLAHLNLDGLAFTPGSTHGVAVVGWGSVLFGKVGMLVIGTHHEQQRLLATLGRRL